MSDSDLAARAKEISWYHTLELAPGVETEGMFDLRPIVGLYQVPERLDGMRVLDVGTFDGFWAFEFARRGAEVVGLDVDSLADVDWPPRRRPASFPPEPRGTGFALAREATQANVERVVCNLYDAKPEDLGTFDLVFAGSILIHIRDQLLALERMAGLTKPGGRFITAEEYSVSANLIPFPVSRYRADREADNVFWVPSARTWKRMIWTSGFDDVEEKGRFKLRSPQGFHVCHVLFHARKA